MKNQSSINVALSRETHKLLVEYSQLVEGKITKIADRAVKEYIEKNKKRKFRRES